MSYLQWDISSVVAKYYVDMTDAGKFVAFLRRSGVVDFCKYKPQLQHL